MGDDAKKKHEKALKEPVKINVPLKDLGNGACYNTAKTDSYKDAKKKADKAKGAKDKAAGAVGAADKALKQAVKDAEEAKNKCLCDVKALHKKQWEAANK